MLRDAFWRRLVDSARVLHPARVVAAAQAFVQIEASGGIVLLLATLLALVWANAAPADYARLWQTHLSFDFSFVRFDEDLRHWVNEGLMSVFFFVVGLEIKRELVHGEMAQARRALLPIAAALGGMALPAVLYLAFNLHDGDGHGWGVPMATDIAFALGVLSLLAGRVPFALKVFVLALAVADDLGTIAIIAVFYAGDLNAAAGAVALALLACCLIARQAGLRATSLYVVLGVAFWAATLQSGITPTVAGVALGLLTPATARFEPRSFAATARGLIARFRAARSRDSWDGQQDALAAMEVLSRESEAPLERLERALHPWVSYGIVPLFGLANLGVDLNASSVHGALDSPIGLGVLVARLVGKPVGILLGAALAVRLGACELPSGLRWSHLAGVGVLGSVGFTVPLFVTNLAFAQDAQVNAAKIALLLASLAGGAAGYACLRFTTRRG